MASGGGQHACGVVRTRDLGAFGTALQRVGLVAASVGAVECDHQKGESPSGGGSGVAAADTFADPNAAAIRYCDAADAAGEL